MAESTVVACPNCGKKFKIAADKLGRTFKCTGCETRFQAGAEAAPPPPPPPVVVEPPDFEDSTESDAAAAPAAASANTAGGKPKSSGMAIASLICGIVICLAPISSVLALVFGFLGLRKDKEGYSGRGLAITGIILGVLGIFLCAGAYLSLEKIRGFAYQYVCAANMKAISTSILSYEKTNQHYPPDLAVLWKNTPILTGRIFVCPTSGHNSYKYVYPGPDATTIGPNDVLLYENLADHNGDSTNIVFGDGHLKTCTFSEAMRLINSSAKHPAPTTAP